MTVDDAEVNNHCLLPGLQVFRLLDEVDENNRLHHAYQLLYSGDMELALKGNLSATVVSKTGVLLELPVCVGSFINAFPSVKKQMRSKGKTTTAAAKAQTSAVVKYNSNKEMQKFRVLVEFKGTGETLANEVFSPGSSDTGVILPKSIIVQIPFDYNGKLYERTDLFVGFTVARVEPTVRMAVVAKSVDKGNLVADDLAEEVDEMSLHDEGE